MRLRRASALGGLLSLALLTSAATASAAMLAARVNGVGIERSRLDRAFADHAARKGRNIAAIQSPSAYRQLVREALDLLVDEELLAQEAVRRGHQPSAEEVARAVAEARASLSGPAQFEIRLEREGLTEATFADRLGRQLAVDRLVARELAPGVKVDDAELHARSVANQERLGQPEATARDVVRQRLTEDKIRAAVRGRVEALRRAAVIEILIPLEPRP